MPGSALAVGTNAVQPAACNVAAGPGPLRSVRWSTPRASSPRGKPLKIVALGSSSTYGAGASTSAASYPSRLADELSRRFPGHEITVLNRGVNGDEAADMLARLDTAVVAEKPDLVFWQVGTNSVLRDKALLPHAPLLHEGLDAAQGDRRRHRADRSAIRAAGHRKANCQGMVSLIATTAKAEHVGLFHRFELMRRWRESEQPAVRDLRLDRRAAHERLELCLPGQGARRGDRRGGDASDRDRGGPHPAPAN